MANFLVTFKHNTPSMYLAEGFEHGWQARQHVIENVIGYNPGVPVVVTKLPLVDTPEASRKPSK